MCTYSIGLVIGLLFRLGPCILIVSLELNVSPIAPCSTFLSIATTSSLIHPQTHIHRHRHTDTQTHRHTEYPEITPQNTVKIPPARAKPPAQLFTASQLPSSSRRKVTPTENQFLQPPTSQAPTEDTSDSETLSRPRTPLSEPSNEPLSEPLSEPLREQQVPIIAQPMATAKPMKPSEYDGKTLDARTVNAWLIRMTTYLTLTNTAENRTVEIAFSYLTIDAFDWYIDNQTTLEAGTFDAFKTSLRDRFVYRIIR